MLSRDASYDGVFFVCVRTTGVFCRPSCPARKPAPKNVEYVATSRDAMLSGYRACKRCRPLDTNGRPPKWVERLLSMVDGGGETKRLTDADLRAASIDPTRARRYFREHYGMTFQAYQRARRLGSALHSLKDGEDVLNVAFGHGFESASGFTDAFRRTFGKTPGRAADTRCVVATMLTSPLGPLVSAATEEGVCLLEFVDRRGLLTQLKTLQRRIPRPVVPGRNSHINALERQLEQYFAGERKTFDVPLVHPGTAFQLSVWRRLLEIPYGETMSYEGLARAIGRPGAQRAVGKANGDNRLAILIPCHRVVQKNGELRGYGGGLWRKRYLLDLERGAEVGLRGGTSNRSAKGTPSVAVTIRA